MLLSDSLLTLANSTEWLALASLKTIPLIAFVLMMQRIFRKQLSATARHLLWLSVLISLSIPFGWNINLNQFSVTGSAINHVDSAQNTASISNPKLTLATEPASSATHTTNVDPALSNSVLSDSTLSDSALSDSALSNTTSLGDKMWAVLTQHYSMIFTIFWLCGATVFLGITVVQAMHFHRIKNKALAASPNTLALFDSCKLEFGINKPVQLLCTQEIQSPITLGWLKPAVILPKNIEQQLTPTTLKHVLLHELGHIKRQDIFFNWLACLINIVHWFNPVVWLACKRMRMDMEMACDELVLSHLDKVQHKSYGATLIEISEIPRVSPKALTTLGILENHTELKERLHMIKEFTTMNIKNTLLFGLILTATAVTSFAQPNTTASGTTQTTAIESSSTTTADDYIDLKDFAKIAEKDLKTKVLVGQGYAKRKILINVSKDSLNYGQFLTQLKINEFTAYKSKDYIQIVPIRDARNLSIPIVEKGKTYYEDEVVTDYLKTEKACAKNILAAVRPLVPQYSHLSVYEDARTMIIIDSYGNIQRIKAVIKALEGNLDEPVDCTNIAPPENRPNKNEASAK